MFSQRQIEAGMPERWTYTFLVGVSSHDGLKRGIIVSDYRSVTVIASSDIEARLLASQVALCYDEHVTEIELREMI